jgi:hypothetical protein
MAIINFAGTSGAPYFDYGRGGGGVSDVAALVDRIVAPVEFRSDMSERIIFVSPPYHVLSHSQMYTPPTAEAPSAERAAETRAALNLTGGELLLLCSNQVMLFRDYSLTFE